MQTHETFLHEVADLALARLPDQERPAFKLVYGIGMRPSAYGITSYMSWGLEKNVSIPIVEISARNEVSEVQLAETVIHELGHVLVGIGHGHSKTWKTACRRLGLLQPKAVGTTGDPESTFASELWEELQKLSSPQDGEPLISIQKRMVKRTSSGSSCVAGIGSEGGKSRGPGSGSRLLKVLCGKCGYTFRITRVWAHKGLPTCICGSEFGIQP